MTTETVKTNPAIKPQELRIGNLVRLRDMDYCNILEVEGIKKNYISAHFALEGFDAEDHPWFYYELEPIPVTPELLTKLSWKRDEMYSHGDMCGLWCDSDAACAFRIFEDELPCTLHYLQNRYYLATGKELNVKPLLNYYLK